VPQFILLAKTCSWQRELLGTVERSQCGIKGLNPNSGNYLRFPTMSQSPHASHLVDRKVRTDQFADDQSLNWFLRINGVVVRHGRLILMGHVSPQPVRNSQRKAFVMVDESFYQLLGVTRSSTVSEIVAARRVLAREFHPDRGGDPQHMALINLAFDAIIASHSEEPAEQTSNTGSRRSQSDIATSDSGSRFSVDRPSFTINALPVVAYEVLLLAARVLGDISSDEPPYLLEVQFEDPPMTWCRLEIVPDAGSSTISFVIDKEIDAQLIRDLWVTTINEIGFSNREPL
jgi:hypothetical protein